MGCFRGRFLPIVWLHWGLLRLFGGRLSRSLWISYQGIGYQIRLQKPLRLSKMSKLLKLWNASLFQEGFSGRSLKYLSLELSSTNNVGWAILASISSCYSPSFEPPSLASSSCSSTSSIIDSYSSSAFHWISPWTFKTPANYLFKLLWNVFYEKCTSIKSLSKG